MKFSLCIIIASISFVAPVVSASGLFVPPPPRIKKPQTNEQKNEMDEKKKDQQQDEKSDSKNTKK